MPVQPMKSIAAVAIADGMGPGAFAAAGILTGGIVWVLGMTRTIELVNKLIPKSIIAGMQIGLGLRMASKGVNYWYACGWLDGVDSKTTGLLCFFLAACMMTKTSWPTALIIFTLGTIATLVRMALQGTEFHMAFLTFEMTVPTAPEWLDGFARGALPQLPLTTLNSVVSVCALSVDLFGDPNTGGKGVGRVSVATSVGFMNLVGCWFGAMPSCHGAGGLAGQFKFGARGGCSVLLLGIAKICLSLVLGQTLDALITFYPKVILGVLLIFAGVELASIGTRGLKASATGDDDLLPCFVTAGAYFGTSNVALGVIAGLIIAIVQKPLQCPQWTAMRAQKPEGEQITEEHTDTHCSL